MLSLSRRRFVSCVPQCRPFSSSPRLSFPAQGEAEGEEKTNGDWSTPKDPQWSVWKKTVGKQFEKSHRPCNWLGGKVPFPLNPSFKPPTPVSDALRNTLYQSFMADPKTNSVRNLAGRYHLSMKRVDAILRLKGLEENWLKPELGEMMFTTISLEDTKMVTPLLSPEFYFPVRIDVVTNFLLSGGMTTIMFNKYPVVLTRNQGKPLQTGFLKGMEQHLGVTYDASKHKTHEDWVESRIQTVEADALDQAEGDNKARTRYQRMFWEPVVEGMDPVLPNALKRAREDAIRHARSEGSSKSVDGTPDYNQKGAVTSTSDPAAGRPATRFIDVGTKFLDPKDHLRRMKESERRARVRSKKVPKRHLMAS
ncbi:eukaryotic mitochondrial regulator protein-domain-containing protein [Lactarius vividus]|nr:eukaryotic mitochondrial regulator protein-domain-containing protein [Lactarius vividus]